MKYLYLIILSLFSLTSPAQSKINADGMRLLMLHKEADSIAGSRAAETQYVTAIVTLNDPSALGNISGTQFEVLAEREDMAIVRMPIDNVERFAESDCVKSMSFGTKREPMMDKAREASFINDVQNGTGLEQPFKGEGVVIGLMDSGIDPNHKAFTNASNVNRVSRVWTIKGESATVTEYDTPEKIKGFTTDNSSSTHGTHVAGIMTGSYDRAGRCRIEQTNAVTGATSVASKTKIQFWGVAPEAEPVMACGDFYDENILLGVEKIIDYAKSVGKPAAINLSLGSNIGAHDGTSDAQRYLAKLGKDAIICIAAGNEGQDKMSVTKTFTASDNETKSFLMPFVNSADVCLGFYDLWTSGSEPVTVTFAIYDRTTASYTYTREFTGPTSVTITPNTSSAVSTAFVSGSSITIVSTVNPNNNRYTLRATVAVQQNNYRYVPAFIVTGKAGQSVEIFVSPADSDMALYSGGKEGWTDGSGENSANTLSTADNIISVGSYTTKNKYYTSTGTGTYSVSQTIGEVSPFSSSGIQMVTGKAIPDICAPGAQIISAYSKYYAAKLISAGTITSDNFAGKAPATNPTDYWHAMQGTSMATPVITGVAATMLQADPTLKVDDVRDIIMKTAVKPESQSVRWGAGKLNALESIKEVLAQRASIGTVMADDDMKIIVTPTPGGYEVFAPGADTGLTVILFDIQGRPVATARSVDGTATLNTAALTPGIYVLTATAPGLSRSQKVTVR